MFWINSDRHHSFRDKGKSASCRNSTAKTPLACSVSGSCRAKNKSKTKQTNKPPFPNNKCLMKNKIP